MWAIIQTRFIFIEGIIGSGKTTTAEFLTQRLRQDGIGARFLAEGPTVDEPEHPLRVATTLPHPRAAWRDVTVDEFTNMSLRMWREFVRVQRGAETVTVCDGLLFHGNMTDLFLMNAPPVLLDDFAAAVLEALCDLNPVLVYLHPTDVARNLLTICDARGRAWERIQIRWKTTSPYGQQRSLAGFAGLVNVCQDFRAVCDAIFAKLTLPKLKVEDDGDWGTRYERLLTFLQLSP